MKGVNKYRRSESYGGMNYRITVLGWDRGGYMVHSLELQEGEIISGEDAVWEDLDDAYSAARKLACAVVDGLRREHLPNQQEGGGNAVLVKTQQGKWDHSKYAIEARQRDGELARVCSIEIDGLLISAHAVPAAPTLDLAIENGLRFALTHLGKPA